MAALSGGGGDKVGNRYEAKWGVLALLRLIKGELDYVRIEKPGETWAEFSTEKDGYTTWYQVKLKGATVAGTIAGIEGVLKAFGPKLHSGDSCEYISGDGCEQVGELQTRASIADNFQGFDTGFLEADGRRKDFERLGTIWKSSSPEQTFDCLKRLEVVTQDEARLESHNELLASTLLQGEASTATDVLFSIYFDHIHQVISRDKLLLLVAAAGIQPRQGPSPKTRWRSQAQIAAQEIVEQLVLIGKFATLEPELGGDYSDWEASAQGVPYPLAFYSDAIAEAHSLCDALQSGDERACRTSVTSALAQLDKLFDAISYRALMVHERWDDARTRVDWLIIQEEGKHPVSGAEARVQASDEFRKMRKVASERDFWIKQQDLVRDLQIKDLPKLKTVISVRDS